MECKGGGGSGSNLHVSARSLHQWGTPLIPRTQQSLWGALSLDEVTYVTHQPQTPSSSSATILHPSHSLLEISPPPPPPPLYYVSSMYRSIYSIYTVTCTDPASMSIYSMYGFLSIQYIQHYYRCIPTQIQHLFLYTYTRLTHISVCIDHDTDL